MASLSLNILNNRASTKEIIKTFIVLIPKIKSPKKVADYRAISLCSAAYKVVTKSLYNRFKVILPKGGSLQTI